MHEIVSSILPGELVFDIGAHTGAKTEWFLSRGARVIAVEPQTACVDALQRRYGNHPNLTIVQKGVSSTAGRMTMHITSLVLCHVESLRAQRLTLHAPDTTKFAP